MISSCFKDQRLGENTVKSHANECVRGRYTTLAVYESSDPVRECVTNLSLTVVLQAVMYNNAPPQLQVRKLYIANVHQYENLYKDVTFFNMISALMTLKR